MFCYSSLVRLRDKIVTSVTETPKRYVITNPSFDFGLLPTDQVSYALVRITGMSVIVTATTFSQPDCLSAEKY